MPRIIIRYNLIVGMGRIGTRVSRWASDTGEGMPDIHGILFANRLNAIKLYRTSSLRQIWSC
jgi:hypothetical protein